jgi:hypothetical protein
MCLGENEKALAIKFIDNLWKQNQKRCALIKNQSGNYEVVPEISLPIENTITIYTLK